MRKRQSTVSVITSEGMCGSVCVCVRMCMQRKKKHNRLELCCGALIDGREGKRKERGYAGWSVSMSASLGPSTAHHLVTVPNPAMQERGCHKIIIKLHINYIDCWWYLGDYTHERHYIFSLFPQRFLPANNYISPTIFFFSNKCWVNQCTAHSSTKKKNTSQNTVSDIFYPIRDLQFVRELCWSIRLMLKKNTIADLIGSK